MATNIAYYTNILKENYAPTIADQLYKATPFLAQLEKSSEHVDIGGRYFYVPLEIGFNEGIGSIGEWDNVPTAGNPNFGAAQYYSWQQVGVIQVSERAMKGSQHEALAYVPILEKNLKSTVANLRLNINRQLFGNGQGALANCTAMGASSTTVPVTSVDGSGNATDLLRVNMVIDIVNYTNGAVLASGLTINQVNKNVSIVVSGAGVQTTASHIIVRTGSYNKEIDGLQKIVATTGVVGTVDPSVAGNELWVANVVPVNGNVSVGIVQQGFDATELAGGKVDLGITTPGVVRAMAAYLESQKRMFVEGSNITLEGGFKALNWNGLPITKDKYCPLQTLYLLDMGGVELGEIAPPAWQEDEKGNALFPSSTTTAWYSRWLWDIQLLTLNRNHETALTVITEA